MNPLPKDDLGVKKFLKESIPDIISSFALNYNTVNYTPLEFYEQEVAAILPRVFNEVFINFMTLSQSGLETIFKGSANSDRLVIRTCKITSGGDLDFSGPEYKTSYISLAYTASSAYNNNWVSPWTEFKKIAEAMGKTSLIYSLQTLNLHRSSIGAVEAKQILVDNGFINVEVTDFADIRPLNK